MVRCSSTESNVNQPKFSQQRVVQNQGACKVDEGSQRNFTVENIFAAFYPNAVRTSKIRTEKVIGKKGKKRTVEPSENCDSESSKGRRGEGFLLHVSKKIMQKKNIREIS